MWPKQYKDYEIDEPLVKESVESGKGIIGCEMRELNGWGNTLHHPKKIKRGFLGNLFMQLFGRRSK